MAIRIETKKIKKLVKLLNKYELVNVHEISKEEIERRLDSSQKIFLNRNLGTYRDAITFSAIESEEDVVINFKQLKSLLKFFYDGAKENLHLAINVEENTKEKLKYLKKMGLKWVDGSSLTKDIPEGLEYIIASLDGINFDRECFYYGSLDKGDIVVTLSQFEYIINILSTARNTND